RDCGTRAGAPGTGSHRGRTFACVVAGKVHSGVVIAGVPAPMLARLESTLPRGPEWRYEPKLDGFRGLLWRSNTGATRVLSRNLKDLSVSFPSCVRRMPFRWTP